MSYIRRSCVLALWFVGACDAPDEREQVGGYVEEPCEAAAMHIAACEGVDSTLPATCDPDEAERLLELPCEVIEGSAKADGFSGLLCAWGQLRHCEVPVCEESLPPEYDFTGMACADLIDLGGCASCDYYRCREAQSAGDCGSEGYYLGFGYQYCMRYRQVTEPRMSEAGQAWSAQTRTCLMELMESSIEDTADCAALRDAGYASHIGCYEDSGFCDLGLFDRLRLFKTIDPEDVDLRLMFEISLGCLG